MQVIINQTLCGNTISLDKFLQFFSLKRWIGKFTDSVSKKLKGKTEKILIDTYVNLRGAKQVVQEHYSSEEARKSIADTRLFKLKLVNFANELEKARYLDDSHIEQLLNYCSKALNELEITLKKRAFTGKKGESDSQELIKALALKSKEALAKTL